MKYPSTLFLLGALSSVAVFAAPSQPIGASSGTAEARATRYGARVALRGDAAKLIYDSMSDVQQQGPTLGSPVVSQRRVGSNMTCQVLPEIMIHYVCYFDVRTDGGVSNPG